MQRNIFLFIVLHFIFNYSAQAQQDLNLNKIVQEMAQRGTLGFDEDRQYSLFLKLNEVASIGELVELTYHLSPAIRGYAFWALAKRNYVDLKSIFIQHLDDQEQVFQKNGCMKANESVIVFMKQVVTPYMYDQECKKLDDATRALVK